ncbi:MAG: HAMP domain-containing protein [Lachnospiraceae bacterium]|jgi:two-component system sensor histidine kinase VanS|nr:HAMP domain-containing protein [Lachnospiraceae bacterium]
MKASLKYSIRHRIMLIFIGLMAAVLFLVWAINNWWLEKYYIDEKRKEMESAYNEIDRVVLEKTSDGSSVGSVIAGELQRELDSWSRPETANPDGELDSEELKESVPDTGVIEEEDGGERTLLRLIRNYGDKNNINMVLIDSNTGSTVLGSGRDSDYLVQKVQRYVLGISAKHAFTLKKHENYVVETNYDFRSRSSYMESWGFLSDNRTLFIMSMPLASIRESVVLANRFTTYVGLAALVLGCILMYFVTNQVTKPLMRLACLSEKMSELDFEVKYEGSSQDEIGVLGRSMNTLSDKLKETIGALKEANQQLQHDIEEKIQIDEMRKEFIANVSHELKTPIALVQGYAEGLSEGMCEDKESRDYYCEVIMDEAGKMNKMVKQLLTLSALEFGRDMPMMERFDIHELIQDLINSVGILIEQKEARILFEPDGPLYVEADEFKIEEVMTNYLNNALNHLSGERVIRIRTERVEEEAVVRVYNTGEPIPEEDIPNLWTKFYKVDKARTRAYGGSGIGLSIVKAIIDAHHQRCGVENVEDGVEFWISLKMAAKDM